jgi:HYR domain
MARCPTCRTLFAGYLFIACSTGALQAQVVPRGAPGCEEDLTPPMVTCPGPISVPATGSCSATVTYVASASDPCGIQSFDCVPPSGGVFPAGVTSVTCTAFDISGNVAACSFNVTVTDPTGTCLPTSTPTATPTSTPTATPTSTPTATPTVTPPSAPAIPALSGTGTALLMLLLSGAGAFYLARVRR